MWFLVDGFQWKQSEFCYQVTWTEKTRYLCTNKTLRLKGRNNSTAFQTILLKRRGKLISRLILSRIIFAPQILNPNNNAHKNVSSWWIPQLL